MEGLQKKRRQPVIGASFWLGALWTGLFFLIVTQESFKGGTLERYTTGHITEYVSVALFSWGIADLLLKMLHLRRERSGLAHAWLPANTEPAAVSGAAALYAAVLDAPERLRSTLFGRRLAQGLYYVREKRSAQGIEEHLRYLAEIDADRSHASYALVRFIAWVVPILGFLGTVVHFTMAIANVTPEQMEHSLKAVTEGLGIAFDTTALALTLSIVVMFGIFLVERLERSLLHEVEVQAYLQLGHRFEAVDSSAAPFIAALQQASERQLVHAATLVEKQVELWTNALGAAQRQSDDLCRRQAEFSANTMATLRKEFTATASLHEERWTRLLAALQTERAAAQTDRMEQTKALLQSAGQLGTVQVGLGKLTEQLQGLLAAKGQLFVLERQLADNLQLLQQTQRIDEAVNGLTAAIHLLTVRQRPAALELGRAA